MKFLVTGGAGFIGRWVVKMLLKGGWEHFSFPPQKVVVVDNLSNGRKENIENLMPYPGFEAFHHNDLLDEPFLDRLFSKHRFDCVLHLAACINVQESIDNPRRVFNSDVVGTMNLLDKIRPQNTPIVFVSTCMVYDMAGLDGAINEKHPTRCASPYAGAKLAAEHMVESYFHAYGLPSVILRPFNTYGPYQKSNGEGGVVAIFLEKEVTGEKLSIYGDGSQTRDLMYVEDCAEFILRVAFSDRFDGRIYNAGSGEDISINDLAGLVCKSPGRIRHVSHIHPQSEINKLLCDSSRAKKTFEWQPRISLQEGIKRTRKHIEKKLAEMDSSKIISQNWRRSSVKHIPQTARFKKIRLFPARR